MQPPSPAYKLTLTPTQRSQVNDDWTARRLTYVENNVHLKDAISSMTGQTQCT
jgi:hypothetical protein